MSANICIVAENHPAARMGGAEYQTHLLTEELARRQGVNVYYLARHTPRDSGEYSYHIRSIGSDRGIRRRAAFFDAAGLNRALRELAPRLIYQQMKQSYTAVCARYARSAGVPFFFHVASQGDLDGAWLKLRTSFNLPFDITEALLGDWGVRRASQVIVQSAAQQRLLQRHYGRQADVLVRNFQPMPEALLPIPAGQMRVAWVGNLKDVKRPELFGELARMFAGDARFHFDMVGRPAHQPRFDALTQALQALPNFTYHGELSVDQVNALLARSSFLVNTSKFEGFPNTFIQAWARGAIVLSLCVDPLDGMEAMELGFVTQTLERMHSKIRELADAPGQRESIRNRSAAYAYENHSLGEARRLADRMLAAAGLLS